MATKWAEAMSMLEEITSREYIPPRVSTGGDATGEGAAPPAPVAAAVEGTAPTVLEAFAHFKDEYVRYLQIYRKLVAAHDVILHPQKRIDIRNLMKVVMVRVIELHHELTTWVPADITLGGATRAAPWSYIPLDDVLLKLGMPPDGLDVPIPAFVRGERNDQIQQCMRLIKGYMYMELNHAYVPLENDDGEGGRLPYNPEETSYAMSATEAIAIIMRNERGRQGLSRAVKLVTRRKEELRKERERAERHNSPRAHSHSPKSPKSSMTRTVNAFSHSSGSGSGGAGSQAASPTYELMVPAVVSPIIDLDDEAAMTLQRTWRGKQGRRVTTSKRDDELIFVGMAHDSALEVRSRDLNAQRAADRATRQESQLEHHQRFLKACEEERERMLEEEGGGMRDTEIAVRHRFFMDAVASSRKAPTVAQFDEWVAEQKRLAGVVAPVKKKAKKGKKGEKGKKKGEKKKKGKEKKKKPAKKDKKKKGKGKGGGSGADAHVDAPPMLAGAGAPPSQLASLRELADAVENYEKTWCAPEEKQRDEDNVKQIHELSMVRKEVRKEVLVTVREQVDSLLRMKLQNLSSEGGGSKKKAKKGKGKKKKKAKPAGGKAKKKKKAGKKKGGKKGKGGGKLPGDKMGLPTDWDNNVSVLVKKRVVIHYDETKWIADFVGAFSTIDAQLLHDPRLSKNEYGEWTPPDPTASQIRALITEYCVLPLGYYPGVLQAQRPEHWVRSVLLYGPRGTGKTMMAEAVANELGAVFCNLSAPNLEGRWPEKTDPIECVHRCFQLAKEGTHGFQTVPPVVIYIDDAEQLFIPKVRVLCSCCCCCCCCCVVVHAFPLPCSNRILPLPPPHHPLHRPTRRALHR